MEDELNRMLGLKGGKDDSKEQSPPKDEAKERSPMDTILNRLTSSAPTNNKNNLPSPQRQSPPNALTKLFPPTSAQNQNKNQKAVRDFLSIAKEEIAAAAKKNVQPNSSPAPQRGAISGVRGSSQRRPPTFVVQSRNFASNPMFRTPPPSHEFFGSSHTHNTSPKLTDLKPSSVSAHIKKNSLFIA
ncbi:hypothetical protein OESDEN_03104 [Oesophagostomum dentatum]|uniref:Uncharacterized protein n=1 Tax=Oesophagostomum dentatum TaxID=61180 RepID=A0A0B1TM58_OESDE|nr:hypothetical protein OESDEN_03104 [Oesophagostomum dentatum]